MRMRHAPKGKRTVYIEHGVWWDSATKHIHITGPAGHRSWSARDPMFPPYREALMAMNRWPADAEAHYRSTLIEVLG